MEGTVYQEYSEPLRMVGSNRSPDIGQLLLPSLPELFSVLVAVPDGGVRGAVEQQDRGRDVGVSRGGANTVRTSGFSSGQDSSEMPCQDWKILC